MRRMVGVWALRRAYRLLLADDPRPVRERLAHEAKRILVVAAVLLLVVVAAAVAGVIALIWLLT